MVVIGLLFILFGALAILAAVFATSGSAQFLGQDLTALAIFLIGLASGLAILWGYTVSKFGVSRSLKHRRERRQLQELSAKLDKVDDQSHQNGNSDS